MRSAIGNSASDPVYVSQVQAGQTLPDGSAAQPAGVSIFPNGSSTAGLTPVTGVGVTSLVVKNAPGNFYGGSMTNGTTAGYLIAYNAASAPAGGAALTAAQVLAAVPVVANGFASIGDYQVADRFTIGIVLLFSTATTTYTIPATPALHMRGKGT